MTYKRIFLLISGLFCLLLPALQSCNSDTDTYIYSVEQSSVGVNGFKIQANAKVLHGLDSVFFSIDLDKALIFNADSLPKGTDVSALIPIISLPSSVSKATITMEGGVKKEGEVDYLKNKSDSIDFTGRVFLGLTSYEGTSRTYELKVNVHTTEPDSLWWGNTALSTLPSRMGNPVEQRSISTGEGGIASLILEADGSYTFSTTEDAFSGVWTKKPADFTAFTPQVRTMVYCDSQYYLLGTEGTLYSSATGYDGWTATDCQWRSITGVYMDNVVGISADGTSFQSYPDASVLTGAVPEGFPVKGSSEMLSLTSQWWNKPYAVLYGGVNSEGTPIGDVWAYDGSRWAQISNGGLPALTGAGLVPYFVYRKAASSWLFNEYSVLMMLGGKDAEGNLNRDMYVSYDNGVHWSKAAELMQMPEFIPGMYDLDAVIATTTMSGNFQPKGWSTETTSTLPSWYRVKYTTDGYDIDWDCPYIYLYGGRDSEGNLYDTIWRGVIRRLTFMPLL